MGITGRNWNVLPAGSGWPIMCSFPGFMGGKEKVRLLQESRALAYTSPKEGWGLSVIEAGACATPVVASNSPGLCESVVDGRPDFSSATVTSRIWPRN